MREMLNNVRGFRVQNNKTNRLTIDWLHTKNNKIALQYPHI